MAKNQLKIESSITSWKVRNLFSMVLIMLGISVFAVDTTNYVVFESQTYGFDIVSNGEANSILVDAEDFEGVKKVAEIFSADVERVSGIKPEVINEISDQKEIIIVGSLKNSSLIKDLAAEGKIDLSSLEGKWESFITQTIEKPFEGVEKALVIVGSDKRGTIYGMFDISEKMGVSPWYWWADVAPDQHETVAVLPGTYSAGEPKVKYRGIFLNDEMPALGGWADQNYGGFTHGFYETVFELLLRLKANYIWPAMWGRSFYDDDPKNAPLADMYGIVIGTSHHEPLARAHAEWSKYGEGPWNYEKNEEVLKDFWRKGMERRGDYEAIITIGMRGDGDEAMSEETATELLESIVEDQREIIEEVTGKPADETPQIWALYKEVQEYYDEGMRVPEDVTLLLCDDNWGNVRVLPNEENRDREGGFGMYYHFDFVGGPVSYKWQNVTQIEKVWEQMNLSYQYGVDRIWLVNVGDLKPMELPISFFLDMAWDPDAWPAERLGEYYDLWANQQFGPEHASEIADILAKYTKYTARRNPEMLSPDLYSLVDYREFETVVEDFTALLDRAEYIYEQIPEEDKNAYYQLVLFPVKSNANLNQLYLATAKNRLYAEQGRSKTNHYAEKVEKLFQKDAEMTDYYHTELSDGKWHHMMAQTHIGYTTWSDPKENIIPETKEIKPEEEASLGVAIEGSKASWPGSDEEAALPPFDPMNNQEYFIDVFNKGTEPFKYEVSTEADWINFTSEEGEITKQERILARIDWTKAPEGETKEKITISGANESVDVHVQINNSTLEGEGYVENNGVVSIEAANYMMANETNGISWLTIPNMGRTHSAITPVPVTAATQTPGEDAPYVEYKFLLFEGGEAEITVHLNPTLNFPQGEGLKYAISVDGEEPQIVNIHEGEDTPDWKYPAWWNVSVTEKVKKKTTTHTIEGAGEHTVRFYMVDPGLVLQKLIIDLGGKKASYLGPPASVLK